MRRSIDVKNVKTLGQKRNGDMGNRMIPWLAHEAQQMLPPTIFFLIWLNLIVLTVALLSDDHQLSAISHSSACVGALLIGKAFLLADKLPFMDRHVDRPLIHRALWSALIYFAMILALHLAERLISAATNSQGFLFRAKADIASFEWSLFLVVQLWLAVLLIIYSIVRMTVREIGPARVRDVLLASPPPPDA
jgi:hypothetical protein